MQLSENGQIFLKTNEGLVLTVKPDCGKTVIGYGHDLLPGESFPNGITRDQADQIFTADTRKWEKAVSAVVPATCTQNQFDALVDFTHECGVEALHELLAHGWNQVPQQLPRWIHAHVDGKLTVLAGMVERRRKEVEMWG